MKDCKLETSVFFLFLTDVTPSQRAFKTIHRVRPVQLFIGADGRRSVFLDETAKCGAVRHIIDGHAHHSVGSSGERND